MKASVKGQKNDQDGAEEGAADAGDEEAKVQQAADDEDDELKKMDGIHAILIGPDGTPLKRNNSDVMNNFFIQFATLSFTDLEQELNAIRNNGELKRLQKFEKEVEMKKTDWQKQTVGVFQQQANKYDNFVKTMSNISGAPEGGKEGGTTESTNSNERNGQTPGAPRKASTQHMNKENAL